MFGSFRGVPRPLDDRSAYQCDASLPVGWLAIVGAQAHAAQTYG
jgi:hypothetical protein